MAPTTAQEGERLPVHDLRVSNKARNTKIKLQTSEELCADCQSKSQLGVFLLVCYNRQINLISPWSKLPTSIKMEWKGKVHKHLLDS